MTTEGEVDDIRGIQDMGVGRRSIFFQPGKEAEDLCFARISRTGSRSSGPRPGWDIESGRADDVLSLPTAWTFSTGLSTEAGIPRLWDTSVPIISETS